MAGWRYAGTGRIEGGVLRLHKMKAFEEYCRHRDDCNVEFTLEKLHAHRSKRQNDYYWSVVVARVKDAFIKRKALAASASNDLVHEILKSQFMDSELVRRGRLVGYISDTGLTLGTSTTSLNKLEFIEYLERIVDHAATAWDCYIPPPDPFWKENAIREQEEEHKRRMVASGGVIEMADDETADAVESE